MAFKKKVILKLALCIIKLFFIKGEEDLRRKVSLIKKLRNKKIKVYESANWGVVLRKNWVDSFASHLSQKEKEEIYLFDVDGACGYMWHLFSYNKRECLKGEEADKVFNEMKKNYCYVFYQHNNTVLILENVNDFNAKDIENEMDIYVVDKGFRWTYVRTHEGCCGPYFCKRDIEK